MRGAFEKISLSPVVYDEVEYFTDAYSYPFINRKNSMPLASSNPLVTTEGRVLTLHKLQLRKNVVCFDTNILQSLMFWQESKCDIIDTRQFDF